MSANAYDLPPKSIVYVLDAYCGWCWGFAERMGEFEAANRDRVNFTAISGGLFIGERIQPIAAYPHIPGANNRVTLLTGAVFGKPYNDLLKAGEMEMNSLDAGAALAALRSQAPDRAVHWAHELKAAFYGRGLSLSEPSTITDIAKNNGLDADAVLRDLQSGVSRAQAQADFALARLLGVSSYPTLLFVDGLDVYQLPATGTPLEVLNEKLGMLLA